MLFCQEGCYIMDFQYLKAAPAKITAMKAQLEVQNFEKIRWPLCQEIDNLREYQAEAVWYFTQLEDATLFEAMMLYYIQGLCIEEVADELHYNPRWVRRLIKRGREEVEILLSLIHI